jgi:hypothetical protein
MHRLGHRQFNRSPTRVVEVAVVVDTTTTDPDTVRSTVLSMVRNIVPINDLDIIPINVQVIVQTTGQTTVQATMTTIEDHRHGDLIID